MDLGAVSGGYLQVSRNTLLGKHEPCARLADDSPALVEVNPRKLIGRALARQRRDPDSMLSRRAQHAGHQLAVGWAGVNTAGLVNERLTGKRRELMPELVGATHERDVSGILVVRLTNHARFTMRRSQRVRRRKAVKPRGRQALSGQVAERGATHGTQSGHDGVKTFHAHQPSVPHPAVLD